MTEELDPKTTAIFEFIRLKHQPSGKVVIKLLNILIDETRKENDTVGRMRLPKNQGRIEGFVQLKDYLERENPNVQ